MDPRDRTVQRSISQLARGSHGVVTRWRLLEAGLTPDEIRHRVRTGLLLPEYRGVYRVGHRAPSLEARYLAAVLAVGPGAFLSGCAAGHLLRLLSGTTPAPEVTAPTERRIPGVITHRARRPDPADMWTWHGIPVSSVPRTLVDLAAVLDDEVLARACHEASVLYDVTPAAVDQVLARRPTSPGARRVRALLGGERQVTLSRLERRFLDRLVEARLPLPVTNHVVDGRRVDCRWPRQGVTVELDGYRFHRSRQSWERDRAREREAYARGDDFRRYTFKDVFEDPGPMLVELRGLL